MERERTMSCRVAVRMMEEKNASHMQQTSREKDIASKDDDEVHGNNDTHSERAREEKD